MKEISQSAQAVGQSIPRLEVCEKLTGRALYIADMSRPGMLHAAILASPVPHARILGYRTDAALAVPGVASVLTGDDFPDCRMGAFVKDEHAIAKDKVRYVGEPVAVIAAESEETARYAARLVEVDYEDLPVILSPDEALVPNAPLIHEHLDSYIKVFEALSSGNVLSETELVEGNVDRGFDQSDRVFENHWETSPQAHVAMEPCGALAEIDANGRVTLWSANQSIFRVQANVCESLGLSMSKVRCVTPRIGGGFGNKMEAHVQPLVVALAIATGRPVKLILSREEDFEMVRARHPYQVHCKTGVRDDGSFVAREVEILVDCGAYGDDSPGVMGYSLLMARGPYRIPNMRAHGRLIYTNKLRFGAFRGFGNPQVSFATESQIDEIAVELGIDPIDLRLKNALVEGDTWFGGASVGSNGLRKCIEQAQSASGWRNRGNVNVRQGKKRALGVACTAHISGLLATGAIIRMLEDGSVVLNTGAVDIGQGSDTVLTQICADALRVPLDMISLASPDTDGSPYNWGTTASRVTYTTGRSIVAAAGKVEAKLKHHAAIMLECETKVLELRYGGRVGVRDLPDREVTFHEISLRAHWRADGPIVGSNTWVFNQPTIDPKRAIARGLPFPQIGVYSFGCVIVDVEVDEITGQAFVHEAWSAMDVGRAINPTLVEGQIEGAFVQGMGMALTEEMVWDGPRLANPTLVDYHVPTTLDSPRTIHSIIVEEPEPDGPFGAKGVGEIGINVVPPAIANAIAAAVGCRLRRLPMTPERILRELIESEW